MLLPAAKIRYHKNRLIPWIFGILPHITTDIPQLTFGVIYELSFGYEFSLNVPVVMLYAVLLYYTAL